MPEDGETEKEFYACSECGAVFATRDELDSHMIEIHKVFAS